jgi:hypothetical protein
LGSELTPRQIRSRVEKQLGLEEGALDTKEYKDAVKEATNEAMVRPNVLLDATRSQQPYRRSWKAMQNLSQNMLL